MKIKITRSLSRSDDIVFSKIFVRPKAKVLEDNRRQVFQYIGLCVGSLSLEPDCQLLDISGSYFDHLFKFKIINKDFKPEIHKEITFEYFPNSKRKCKNCIHARRYNNNKLFCDYKSKKIENNNWDNCWDWQEDSILIKK